MDSNVLYAPRNLIASMGFQQLDQQKLIQHQNQWQTKDGVDEANRFHMG